MKKRMIVICAVLAVVMAGGCGAPKQKTTGFLSDYSKLQRETDTSLKYVDEKAAPSYTAFIVDPVQARIYPGAKSEGKLTPDQLKDLTNYFHTKIVEAVEGAGLKVAYQPGSGVARIRVALTDIAKTDAINMLPQASLLGAGVGGASMEAEFLDSVTGRQIAAVVQSQQGSRVPFSNLGDWTAAKGVIDAWTKRFQNRLLEIHGKM